ncbi:MAG: cell division protein ZapA [Marinilabiliales bacterium]|nr:MAG: cell division protein ZapA [Marinilabiliales bacterium]
MDDKLSIRVNVAERFYPLKISRGDEEKIRKAARLINEKVLQYKQRYTDKDLQDFLAMAALQFVIRLLESEEKTDVAPIWEQLKDLEQELGDYIQGKKSNSVL